MSSAITIDPSVIAFLKKGAPAPVAVEEQAPSVDMTVLEERVRAKLEPEYQARLEMALEKRMSEERTQYEKLLNECMGEFDGVINAMRRDIQTNVIDLSIQISEIILRHDLPDSDMLRNVIVKILEPVSDLQGVRIRISSSDWQAFGGVVKVGEDRGLGETIEFLEDPNLSTGDVIVESRNGIFDARLSERMKLLKETLSERCGTKEIQSSVV